MPCEVPCNDAAETTFGYPCEEIIDRDISFLHVDADSLQRFWLKLSPSIDPQTTSLILGVLWAFCHLPLFFIAGTSQQIWGSPMIEFGIFAIGVIGLSVIFTWLYIKSGGSLWSAILFHFTYNGGASF